MKRKSIILYLALTILQLILISSGFFLNYLSSKKAGVMRHIYTRGLEHQSGIYSPDALLIHQIMMVSAAILILFVLKDRKCCKRFESMLSIFLAGGFVLIANLAVFADMIAYTYILMGFEAAILISLLKTVYIKFT